MGLMKSATDLGSRDYRAGGSGPGFGVEAVKGLEFRVQLLVNSLGLYP